MDTVTLVKQQQDDCVYGREIFGTATTLLRLMHYIRDTANTTKNRMGFRKGATR